jgi:hypothetical protein
VEIWVNRSIFSSKIHLLLVMGDQELFGIKDGELRGREWLGLLEGSMAMLLHLR